MQKIQNARQAQRAQGDLAPHRVLALQHGLAGVGEPGRLNVADLREASRKRLPRGVFEFFDRGSEYELSLTGNFLDAATAERWGLVNRVVEADALLPTAIALARDMASIDPAMAAAYKALIDDGFALPFGEGLKLEAERSIAANTQVAPEAVEQARQAVMARGRSQG